MFGVKVFFCGRVGVVRVKRLNVVVVKMFFENDLVMVVLNFYLFLNIFIYVYIRLFIGFVNGLLRMMSIIYRNVFIVVVVIFIVVFLLVNGKVEVVGVEWGCEVFFCVVFENLSWYGVFYCVLFMCKLIVVMVMFFFFWLVCGVVGVGVLGYELYDDCLVGFVLICLSDGLDG